MIYQIVNEFPNDIIYEKRGPFISLYQPTHRHRPENKQDIIRFNNLVQEIENTLGQRYHEKDIESLLKPFKALSQDKQFWNNTTDGLAVLASSDKCVVYKLQRPVEELSEVGDKFHIKPLIRYFQSSDRYLVLGIDRKRFSLFEGNRYGLEEIEVDPEIPITIEDVLGDQYTEPYLNPSAYGGAGGTPMFHGHGGRKDEVDKDTEKYFRYVDKFVSDNYSKVMGIPLILAALQEHQGLFRNITNNSYLIDNGIDKDFNSLSKEELREGAWEIMLPFYLEKTKLLVDRYNIERSRFLASDDLAEVTRAVLENRVDTILLEADRDIPGKINKDTGELEIGQLNNAEFDNVVNNFAKLVFKNKGEIVVLPKERMPSETGVAAIFRY